MKSLTSDERSYAVHIVEDSEPLPRYLPKIPVDDEYQRIIAQGMDAYRRRAPFWCARDTWSMEQAASLLAGILPRLDGEGRIFYRRYVSDTGTVVIGENEYPNLLFRIFTDNFDFYEHVLEKLRGSPLGECAPPREWALFANAQKLLPPIKRPDIDNSPLLSLLEPDCGIGLTSQESEKTPSCLKFESAGASKLFTIQIAAFNQFFNPRRNPDVKKGEVVDWIISEGYKAGLPIANYLAGTMFTIIKPHDHNPRKKRVEPQ